MFDQLFNDEAIKELAGILAEQDTNKTAKEVLKEMDIRSIGFSEKLQDGITAIILKEGA